MRNADPITNMSRSVPIKHRKASVGVHTIGSPLTLKEVFTRIGQPVKRLKSEIRAIT